MEISPDTKICKMCGEEIKAVARRCPHCTSFQSAFSPGLIMIVVMVLLMAALMFMMSRGPSLIDKGSINFPIDAQKKAETIFIT